METSHQPMANPLMEKGSDDTSAAAKPSSSKSPPNFLLKPPYGTPVQMKPQPWKIREDRKAPVPLDVCPSGSHFSGVVYRH